MKRIVSCFMIFFMLITVLASCRTVTDNNDSDGTDISAYKIVYPENASDAVIKASNVLQNTISEKLSADLKISNDYLLPDTEPSESECEILVGETNRSTSANAKTKLDNDGSENLFVIEKTQNKIAVIGTDDETTLRAIKYFIVNFVSTSEKEGTVTISENYSKIHTVKTDTVILSNLVELGIGDITTVYQPDKFTTVTHEYPTIIELAHNGKNNGTLFASLSSGDDYYKILKSTDGGKKWEEISIVKDSLNKTYHGGAMPFLYELPADIGDFKEGTLILSGMSRDSRDHAKSTETVITTYASKDLGETWTPIGNVSKAGGNDLGIWEPFLIYEEETERIYCFYSDDSDLEHDQKLVFKYSTDLVNWTGKNNETGIDALPFEAVACNDKNLRPGMISIAKMGNGEYIMTYEMVGESMNPIYYKKTASLDDWGDISDKGTKIVSDKGQSFGSSPWCAWSPVGGECGTLVVAAKHWTHEGSLTEKNAPDLFFSFDYGKTFTSIENPIDYTINEKNRCGYSPALLFSADGKTLYYLNNPNFGILNDSEYIAMVKIEIFE